MCRLTCESTYKKVLFIWRDYVAQQKLCLQQSLFSAIRQNPIVFVLGNQCDAKFLPTLTWPTNKPHLCSTLLSQKCWTSPSLWATMSCSVCFNFHCDLQITVVWFQVADTLQKKKTHKHTSQIPSEATHTYTFHLTRHFLPGKPLQQVLLQKTLSIQWLISWRPHGNDHEELPHSRDNRSVYLFDAMLSHTHTHTLSKNVQNPPPTDTEWVWFPPLQCWLFYSLH